MLIKAFSNSASDLNKLPVSFINNGTAPSYLNEGVKYYSYDGHYFYDNYNTMITDYKNNVRNNAVNPYFAYYSYFQYLPMRSQTTYTGCHISYYLNN